MLPSGATCDRCEDRIHIYTLKRTIMTSSIDKHASGDVSLSSRFNRAWSVLSEAYLDLVNR